MKYFFDTEFIERFVYMYDENPENRVHTVIPISIGIVAEDGREYYAINKHCRWELADDWVKENVIRKLPNNWLHSSYIHRNLNPLYKSLDEIKADILAFAPPDSNPEFYAYYADYDWVAFCQIFGRMIDLPKGYPMYCRDLKQTLDEYVQECMSGKGTPRQNRIYREEVKKLGGLFSVSFKSNDFQKYLDDIKSEPNYPKQDPASEHNALDDARWNEQLYQFIEECKNELTW